jgi:hypothetical protein
MLDFLNLKTNLSKRHTFAVKPTKQRQLPFRDIQLGKRFQAGQKFTLNLPWLLVVPGAYLVDAVRGHITTKLPSGCHTISHFCDSSWSFLAVINAILGWHDSAQFATHGFEASKIANACFGVESVETPVTGQ